MVLPHSSVAVQVLVMVKLLGQEPGVVISFTAKVISTFALQLSVAETEPGLAAGILSHSAEMSVGTPVITGSVVSSTVIV